MMTWIRVLGRSDTVPGKPRLNCAWLKLSVGPTRAPVMSAIAKATVSAVMLSVPIRPVGPCCSVEPVGMTTPVEFFR